MRSWLVLASLRAEVSVPADGGAASSPASSPAQDQPQPAACCRLLRHRPLLSRSLPASARAARSVDRCARKIGQTSSASDALAQILASLLPASWRSGQTWPQRAQCLAVPEARLWRSTVAEALPVQCEDP